MNGVDHILLTRFNLPSGGIEGRIRARDGWLRSRIELFERYTVPSVRHQGCQDFRWLVYLDRESPQWLLDRLAPLVDEGLFVPLLRDGATPAEVLVDIREVLGTVGDTLITTNLDNDDGLARGFIARLQGVHTGAARAAVYLANGLVLNGSSLYLHRDPTNAFCTVRESWQQPMTCWADWHNLLPQHMPAVVESGSPAWLQVIHGGNVSNRVRGRLVDPIDHRAEFGDLIADVPSPSRRQLRLDAFVRQPGRRVREVVRRGVKGAIMRGVGKDGLDRLKAAAAPLRALRDGARAHA